MALRSAVWLVSMLRAFAGENVSCYALVSKYKDQCPNRHSEHQCMLLSPMCNWDVPGTDVKDGQNSGGLETMCVTISEKYADKCPGLSQDDCDKYAPNCKLMAKTPEPTSQPTPTPTSVPTPTPTPEPTLTPTPWPTAYPTAQPTPAPTIYVTPWPTPRPTALALFEGSCIIVNVISGRALYATGKDEGEEGVGAAAGMGGVRQQQWKLVNTGAHYQIVNAANQRRLYAKAGFGATYGINGMGATLDEEVSDDQLWKLIPAHDEDGDEGFRIENVQSGRFLFAIENLHGSAGFGASINPVAPGKGGRRIWKIRLQQRKVVIGSTIVMLHSRTSKMTNDVCTNSASNLITCESTDDIGNFSKYEVVKGAFNWASDGGFALKNLGNNKFCKDTFDGIACMSDTVTGLESFTSEKLFDDNIALKGGRLGKFCSANVVPDEVSYLKGTGVGIHCNAKEVDKGETFVFRCVANCAKIDPDADAVTGMTVLTDASAVTGIVPKIAKTWSTCILGAACLLFGLGLFHRRQSRSGWTRVADAPDGSVSSRVLRMESGAAID